MATTPTQLPVPSEKPQDLKFNAGKIDEFVTSLVLKYIDRLGQEHYTIEGLRQLALQAIAAFGWIPVDSFQEGATLTLPNQVLRWKLPDGDGEYYRWDGAFPKVVPAGSTPDTTGDDGFGAWIGVGDASLRAGLVNPGDGSGDALITVNQPSSSASPRTLHDKLRDYVDVMDFIPEHEHDSIRNFSSTYDCTGAIQNYINWASHNNVAIIYLPSGIFNYTRLFLTYDSILNPGFDNASLGNVILKGEGRSPSKYIALGTTPEKGTVLFCTATNTDSTIVFATASQTGAASGYPNRLQKLCNLTVIANNAGWVIENNASPELSGMEKVLVIQKNTNGKGVLWAASWYTVWWQVSIGMSGVSSVTASKGLQLGSALFAGQYSFTDSSVSGFYDAVFFDSTNTSTNFAFDRFSFEGAGRYGVCITKALRNISFRDCYFEGNKAGHLKVDVISSTQAVQNLEITSCFAYGGDTAAKAQTEAMFDVTGCTAYSIDNLHVFRPQTSIIKTATHNITGTGFHGTLSHCTVDYSDTTYDPSAKILCVDTPDQSSLPIMINNAFPTTANIKPFLESLTDPATINQSGIRSPAYFYSAVSRRALNANFAEVFPQVGVGGYFVYTVTADSCVATLPAIIANRFGASIVIANSSVSTKTLTVKNQDATTLMTLEIGTSAQLVADGASTKWIAIKSPFIG